MDQSNTNAVCLPAPAEVGGLLPDEAARRQRAGMANDTSPHEARTVGRIIRDNVLTLFNLVNLALAVLIVAFGDMRNTLFFGVALLSTLMGIAQELRARAALNRLSILNRAMVHVVRGGAVERIDSTEIVLGDTLLLRAGNQLTADGTCTQALGLSVNESLLTGEADEVEKRPGDPLWSGSFVTAGTAYVTVTAVGRDSFAARLGAEAKKEKKKESVLERTLGRMIRVLAVIIVPMGVVLFAVKRSHGLSVEATVTGIAAALVGMIPQGLILLKNIAFAVGVVNLGRHKTLVQSLPCIEALARVDTLCLDKTGTITSGDLTVRQVIALPGHTREESERTLARLLDVLPDDNATARALKRAFLREGGSDTAPPVRVMPFSSARKTSGAVFPDETLMLGAVSYLLPSDAPLCEQAEELSRDGSRVLALARGEADGAPTQGVALLVLEDSIRPEARDTFAYFQAQGVTIKVISGDSAAAASGIARRAGIERAEDNLSLAAEQFGEKPLTGRDAEKTVFGRVSPDQKRTLIRLMRDNGHTVAMTGDGVNDVLALKEADCGVAVASGSEAARAVADLVLLSSDFLALPAAVNEGRRVINNIGRVSALYLSKTIFSALLALIFLFLRDPYPFAPVQMTLIGALTIGIPSFFLSLEPNYRPLKRGLLRTAIVDAAATAVCIAALVPLARILGSVWGYNHLEVSTICTIVTGALGLSMVYRASRPFSLGRGLLCAGVTAAFLNAFLWFSHFFGFASLWGSAGLTAAGLTAIGIVGSWLLRRLIPLVRSSMPRLFRET